MSDYTLSQNPKSRPAGVGPRTSQPAHPEVICPRCGVIDTVRVESGQWGPHTARAVCRHCDAFLRWVSPKTPEQRQALRQRGVEHWMASQSPTEKQLACLKALGHGGPPANRLDASRRIDELLSRREVRDE
jgi:hypothetical protein